MELTNTETLSLQHQVEAVAPFVTLLMPSGQCYQMSLQLHNFYLKVYIVLSFDHWSMFKFLERLVSTLEEKKHHEAKLKEGLKDSTIKRMELQNSFTSVSP
uniref:Uncharacterized protein n=1 Tax=Lactuca sativa TaxID=4236 RepID=A0A9R1WVZ6_LACSA|nr:hypothetical protein LSAT_V11C800403880 [Lactuca sativa]